MTKQIAAYDDDGIWGVGDTEEQARAEAEGFIRDCFEGDDEGYQEAVAGLKIAPISEDLINRAATEESTLGGKVTINYSDIPFMLDADGVLVYDADKAEANAEDGVTAFIEGEDDDEDDDEGGDGDEDPVGENAPSENDAT